MPDGAREWLSTGEVARELGFTRLTVTGWCRSGALPSVLAGGRYRVRRADLAAFLKPGGPRPAAPAGLTPEQRRDHEAALAELKAMGV